MGRRATANLGRPTDAFARHPAEHALHEPQHFEEGSLAHRIAAKQVSATFLDFRSLKLCEHFLRGGLRNFLVHITERLAGIRQGLDRLRGTVEL